MKKRRPRKTATSIRKRRSRFIHKQRHKASCGPIAIANVIKWHKIETSYAAVLEFCEGIRAYHPRKGMWPYQMRYVLRTLQIKFKVRRRLSIRQLENILNKGGSLILIYETKKLGAHAVFIDGINESQYRVWNRRRGHAPWCDKVVIHDSISHSMGTVGHIYAYIFQSLKP